MADQNNLIEFLKWKTSEEWELRQQPYLLSLVPTEFPEPESVYREILDGERLKAFVKRTAQDAGYTVVEHPRQKAKVGLVPSNSHFKWADEPHSKIESASNMTVVQTPTSFQSFLHSLAALSDNELDGMNIPLKTILKLAGLR